MEHADMARYVKDHRVEMTVDGLKGDFAFHIRYSQSKEYQNATTHDLYLAFANCVRDRLIERWLETQSYYRNNNVKRVYYMSLEFLIGRLLGNNVINLKMEDICDKALKDFGINWNELRDMESDAGLGNGGLGRLAACFLDSLSTLNIPAMGYGLRYDYGIFKQTIRNGQQIEEPDNWLKNGYPWEIARPEYAQTVQFGGRVEYQIVNGRNVWRWVDTEKVIGLPYDLPIVGYNEVVNNLRLWSAKADDEFRLEEFNKGSYVEAVEAKVLAENLTKVLYPNDNIDTGKELRLRQQYFFVSCSIQDILRRFLQENSDWDLLPEKAAIQLNDTHPTLVIPELMRLLVDKYELDWDRAWGLTCRCTAYTNHTVLPEALEKWSISLLEKLLPRHMQIIYEINRRFLQQVAALWPGDNDRLARMSIINEKYERSVRMANLAIVGSSAVNGVARLHTEILKKSLFKDFYELYPSHFSNKTNGITQRRWLLKANPELSRLITENIGDKWITDLDELAKLEPLGNDADFLRRFGDVKNRNKSVLAGIIRDTVGITVDPASIFDVQVKRLHEYKRQLLLALYIIVIYNRLLDDPSYRIPPRTFIFAAKAAPGYAMAKLIIRFIHGIADVVNNDPRTLGRIKVVFLPDYRVSLAEKIIPAANLSEQISLAGTEASGTGNMKLMMNGALTIGTLDGANIEINEAVGDDNMFIFGMKAEEVDTLRPAYSSREIYQNDPEIREAIDSISKNVFSPKSYGCFDQIVRTLLDYNDYYMLLADLRSFIETQDRVNALYAKPQEWNRKALINVARSGRFSSDRTISEYVRDIWHVSPVSIKI
ncbi:MAG: glycogen/starch/alpha-glucan phosphorylase [Kiritimatiellae bacterium]|nr:glycogen/starch/alpha-glucan phosphorylase [Kiritimatiellia bacterium]